MEIQPVEDVDDPDQVAEYFGKVYDQFGGKFQAFEAANTAAGIGMRAIDGPNDVVEALNGEAEDLGKYLSLKMSLVNALEAVYIEGDRSDYEEFGRTLAGEEGSVEIDEELYVAPVGGR